MTPTPQATPRTDALISSGPFSGPKDVIELWDRAVDTCRELEIALSAAEARVKVYWYEAQRNRAMFESAIETITRITALIHADDVVLPDGRRFKFHPPDELVREAWEGLSSAIRAALAGKQEEGR
jgi:hypothetical protein